MHPLLISSPFFRDVDLEARGVQLCMPKVPFAHPLEGGRAAAVLPSVAETAATLGRDARTYRRLFGPLVRNVDKILPAVLRPIRPLPPPPLAMARFGLLGLVPASRTARRFRTEEAQALIAGAAAHSMLSLSAPLTSSFGLLFITVAHALGWPVVAGGSERIVTGLCEELESLGGRVHTGRWVKSLDELSGTRTVLLDVSPAPVPGPGRRSAGPRPEAARAVPLRTGRVQGRLGAVGPRPLGGRGLPGGRDGARLRPARRGRALRV